MKRPTRVLLIVSILAAGALLGSCGKSGTSGGGSSENGTSENGTSEKGTAESGGAKSEDRIHLGRGLAAGDGVRITMESKGTTQIAMAGTDMETKIVLRMSMTQRCERRTEDGGSVFKMVMEEFEVEGLPMGAGTSGLDQLKNMKGTMTVGPDGKTTDFRFEGLDPSLDAIVTPMLKSGGFSSTFPSGPEGLRIGDTVSIEDVMPVGQLSAGLAAGMPAGMGAAPGMTAEGGYTLVGVREIDGVKAAEFAVDISTTLDMDMGERGSMATSSTSKGTQFVNIATGMPIGTSTLDQTSSSKMNMKLQGETQAMSTTGSTKVTTRAEVLK